MSLTFNLELDFRQNKKGEKLLMIRCSQHGNHKRISTGIHLIPKFWDNAKKLVKKNHTLAPELNKAIAKKLSEIEGNYLALMSEKEEVSLMELVHNSSKTKSANFYQFALDFKLNQFRASKKLGTYRRYEAVLNKLKDFAGKSLTVKQINYTLLKSFENYLFEKRMNSRDTVSSNLSVIRSILNEAIKHGLYDKKNPFDSLSLIYTQNTKYKMTIEELKAFNDAVLPKINSVHLARDFFMACFYAAGCRAGDMVLMKWENICEDKLIYSQQKTGKQLILPVLPELNAIFQKYKSNSHYIFPLLAQEKSTNELIINSKITYINKYLKEVCKYAGIFKKITTHCARHTFSDISLDLNNNDIYGLKDVLGHSSVKTTEIYLRERNYSKADGFIKKITELFR